MRPGGLAGLEEALQDLKAGKASAIKYVVRIDETKVVIGDIGFSCYIKISTAQVLLLQTIGHADTVDEKGGSRRSGVV